MSKYEGTVSYSDVQYPKNTDRATATLKIHSKTTYSILIFLYKLSSNVQTIGPKMLVSLHHCCFQNYAGNQISMKSVSLKEITVSCVNIWCVKPYFERFLSLRDVV